MVQLTFRSDTNRGMTKLNWSGIAGDNAIVTRAGFITQTHQCESLADAFGALLTASNTLARDQNRPKTNRGRKKAVAENPATAQQTPPQDSTTKQKAK